MQVKVDSKLRIKNPTHEVKTWCQEHLILDNPDYFKLERIGKWTGNTPKFIWLYEEIDDELWLPFGCIRDIWSIAGNSIFWKVNIHPIRRVDYRSGIILYPYQKNAVELAIKVKNGVLVMPCGSGKTQCGLEIIAKIGGKALWLTHMQDLLTQSKKRAESVLGYVGAGVITAGKVNTGHGITFATVQTMSKIDLVEHKDDWDVIIVDECQHAAGSPTRLTQFYKVISNLVARYKIGLTATPKRADGLERAMFALLGGKICEVTRDEVAHTTCPVMVRCIDTGWVPDYDCVLMGDGTIDYMKVIDSMIHDEARYKLVLYEVINLDGPAIVLANRVEYLEQMRDSMFYFGKKVSCLSGMGQSKKAKAEREAALKSLNDGELDCVLATYQLAKEGLDVPNLKYIVFATPEKEETTVIQSVGRVSRKADGKDHGTVLDFIDGFEMYKGWAKKRAAYYKKIGAEVVR